MFKKIIYALMLCIIAGPVFGQAKVYVDSLFSQSIGRTMPLSIIIPSYYDNQKSLPILYLLHGHSISHEWFRKHTDIEKYVEEDSVICIMPQADNSWWINSYSVPEDRFEDYLMIDVTNYIEHKYTVDKGNQFIAGFSMGGYGALVLALRHPDRFTFVASIAGAIAYPRDKEILEKIPRNEFAVPSLNRAFGELPNAYRNEHDPFFIYKKIPLENLPYIFLFNGIHDFFPNIPIAQREFADSLNAINAMYEYYELQGGHNSITVNPSLKIFLQRIQMLRHRKYKSLSSILEQTILKSGIEQAIIKYHKLKANKAKKINYDEQELNGLEYELLQREMLKEAIAIFQLNIESYPESSNVYDSFGEALEKNNELEQAAENYKKAYTIGVEQSSNLVNVYKRHLDRVLNKLQGK